MRKNGGSGYIDNEKYTNFGADMTACVVQNHSEPFFDACFGHLLQKVLYHEFFFDKINNVDRRNKQFAL